MMFKVVLSEDSKVYLSMSMFIYSLGRCPLNYYLTTHARKQVIYSIYLCLLCLHVGELGVIQLSRCTSVNE